MKQIVVDETKCMACGACVAIDGEHFAFDENGLSKVISNDNLESTSLSGAIDSCPTGAISIEEGCCCGEKCECGETCECESNCACGDDCNCTEENNCGCK